MTIRKILILSLRRLIGYNTLTVFIGLESIYSELVLNVVDSSIYQNFPCSRVSIRIIFPHRVMYKV